MRSSTTVEATGSKPAVGSSYMTTCGLASNANRSQLAVVLGLKSDVAMARLGHDTLALGLSWLTVHSNPSAGSALLGPYHIKAI